MTWPTGYQPFGPNRAPLLSGLSSLDAKTEVPVAVDPATGNLATSTSVTPAALPATLYTGQVTVSTTQVRVSSVSNTLSNGIIIKALSTNTAAIYVGLTGVTTTTGDILEPGERAGYAVNNTNLLWIISVASTTDKISYAAN